MKDRPMEVGRMKRRDRENCTHRGSLSRGAEICLRHAAYALFYESGRDDTMTRSSYPAHLSVGGERTA